MLTQKSLNAISSFLISIIGRSVLYYENLWVLEWVPPKGPMVVQGGREGRGSVGIGLGWFEFPFIKNNGHNGFYWSEV